MQLETKVSRGYCCCFTLIITPIAIIVSFYNSNAWHLHNVKWTGNKDENLGDNVLIYSNNKFLELALKETNAKR